ncbi:kinase-like protein, partial [Marasmius fiardii PR-910]
NVLVDEQGHCYLADFGLAAAAITSTLLSTLTSSSGGKGTMRWMAPELFSLQFRLSRDIYAYACTVYEIVAGTIPFAHLKHDAQVMLYVLSGERPEQPTATAWCPNIIWILVQQCWAQESHLRPTAAAVHAFLAHLEQLRGKGLPWESEFPDLVQAER